MKKNKIRVKKNKGDMIDANIDFLGLGSSKGKKTKKKVLPQLTAANKGISPINEQIRFIDYKSENIYYNNLISIKSKKVNWFRRILNKLFYNI